MIGIGLAVLSLCGLTQAETPWNRAVGSEAGLISYCREHSTRAYVGVSGDNSVVAITNAHQELWVYSEKPLELDAKVAAQSLGFGVVAGSGAYFAKTCQYYQMAKNRNGEGYRYRLMFWGSAQGKEVKIGDTKQLAWEDLVMRLPGTVELDFPEDYAWGNAIVKKVDENGNVQFDYLGDGNSFEFPSALAGAKNGSQLILQGYTRDGFQIGQVVNLNGGDFLPIDEHLIDFGSVAIDGVSYHCDGIDEVISSNDSVGRSPLFQMESTGQLSVRISVRTSEGEYPQGFWYRTVDGAEWGEWKYEQIMYPNNFVLEKFHFPSGKYHIDFDWKSLHREIDWTPNYGGVGGKG